MSLVPTYEAPRHATSLAMLQARRQHTCKHLCMRYRQIDIDLRYMHIPFLRLKLNKNNFASFESRNSVSDIIGNSFCVVVSPEQQYANYATQKTRLETFCALTFNFTLSLQKTDSVVCRPMLTSEL